MDDNGNTREDLMLPKGTDEADKLAETIKTYHTDGKEMVVTVLKVAHHCPVDVPVDTICLLLNSVNLFAKTSLIVGYTCGQLLALLCVASEHRVDCNLSCT